MAYLTKDHFEYLATWKDKKYDSSDTDHIQAFQKLKDSSLYTTNFTEPLSYQDSAFLKLPKFP